MILSRQRASSSSSSSKEKNKNKVPTLQEFIDKRDYIGAATLCEFLESSYKRKEVDEAERTTNMMWLAYSYFHAGKYDKAAEAYRKLIDAGNQDSNLTVFLACCLFYMGEYEEAEEIALKAIPDELQKRLLFHLAQKSKDEDKLIAYHAKLQDTTADQLCLASVHCLRGHYQEAIEVYKSILSQNRKYLALSVAISIAYYRLDYYEVSLEIVDAYLKDYPDSITAVNLKACNVHRLYNGQMALKELDRLMKDIEGSKNVFGDEVLRHNRVVFRNGADAQTVLTSLLDVIPEARLNLVIFNLQNGHYEEAFELMKDVEPTTPQEYILKAVTNCALGQEKKSNMMLQTAKHYFQLIGSSESEQDTIPGRQCMASAFIMTKKFDDAYFYLDSIREFFSEDDTFNTNLGVCMAANGDYENAVQTLRKVQNESYYQDVSFLSWLALSLIHCRQPADAYDLWLNLEDKSKENSFKLLLLLANECYRCGCFYYAAQAFDVLTRMEPNDPTMFDGKRNAILGCWQSIVAGQEPHDTIRELFDLLHEDNPQANYIRATMQRWESGEI